MNWLMCRFQSDIWVQIWGGAFKFFPLIYDLGQDISSFLISDSVFFLKKDDNSYGLWEE